MRAGGRCGAAGLHVLVCFWLAPILAVPSKAAGGGGAPDTDLIRAARKNIRYHLAYIDWLVRAREWLAGERLSYADLAAAAHVSAADDLGDVPWTEDEAAKN